MLGKTRGKRLNQYVSDYIVYDLETTGTSSQTDQVVEISAIKVLNGNIAGEFSRLVNPECSIPYYASQVNGITDDMVEDEPVFEEILPQFLDFIGDMVLVGHNIHVFDMKFIYRDCEEYFGKIPTNDYVDTLILARGILPQLNHHKLTDLAAHYGISTAGAHRALNDCHMNQKVYECLAKELKNAKKHNPEVKICPRCGQFMKKRNGRFGEFWGCGGYPNCRYTENL